MLAIVRSFPKATACGPSGLHIQQLLDAAEVQVPTAISSTLRDIVNLLASGKVPLCVLKYLAGGSHTALVKNISRCSANCSGRVVLAPGWQMSLCLVTKSNVAYFFAPHLFELACPSSAENTIHGLMDCMDNHGRPLDFVVL